MAAAAVHRARVSSPSVPLETGAHTSSRMNFLCYKYCVLLEPTLLQIKFCEPNQLIRYRELTLPRSFLKEEACKQLAHDIGEQQTHDSSHSILYSRAQPSMQTSDVMTDVQDLQSHKPSNQEGDAYLTGLSKKEIERRGKIGAANKGKVPWTKGKKLSNEHKQLIKQRTIEALRDPKVRKKMLGHRQLHRQVSKDKISAALRKIWERRIVSVRSKQMVLWIWSNSIAEAAKQGDLNQDKLDWDSYDKIKSQMISMFLLNKEREQIIKKLKKSVAKVVAKNLQTAAKVGAKNFQTAGRMKVHTTVTKKYKSKKLVLHNLDIQPTRVVVSTRPKLKERLTKWHHRKKELEAAICSRTRKGRRLGNPGFWRKTEKRAEVDLAEQGIEALSAGRLKEFHLSCEDALPCTHTMRAV